eukprot:GEMP01046292.1.p1 GENE.GEMP01046292.1~~GEMP01046292.1.p1  ORF type:complete len:182 (+),score=38.48 GEMP01046292.1:166-711(+)
MKTVVNEHLRDLGRSLLRTAALYVSTTILIMVIFLVSYCLGGNLPMERDARFLDVLKAPFTKMSRWEHIAIASLCVILQEIHCTLEFLGKNGYLMLTLVQIIREVDNERLDADRDAWEEWDVDADDDDEIEEDDPLAWHGCIVHILLLVGPMLPPRVPKISRLWRKRPAYFLFLPRGRDDG